MATKKIKTTLDDDTTAIITESTEETVTLSESHANHGHIVTRYGVIEFIDRQAIVSSILAKDLRSQGFIV